MRLFVLAILMITALSFAEQPKGKIVQLDETTFMLLNPNGMTIQSIEINGSDTTAIYRHFTLTSIKQKKNFKFGIFKNNLNGGKK